jgi:hypothetical protein
MDALSPPPPASESAGNLVSQYFRQVREILTEPTKFFARMPLTGGIGGPLAFALVTSWVAKLVEFLFDRVLGIGVTSLIMRMLDYRGEDIDTPAKGEALRQLKLHLADWLTGTGLLVTMPFWTLLWLLSSSALICVGARLLANQPVGSPRTRYEAAVRLLSYGSTPLLLGVIPFIGGWAALIYCFIVTVIGAKAVYEVPTGRAVVIALFPKIFAWTLGIGVLLMVLFVFAGLIFKLS